MRATKLVLILFFITSFISASAIAENANSLSEDSDSFHLPGIIFLGFAVIGWTFILVLLVNAIIKIFRKAKTQSVAGQPIKCK